MNATTFAEGEDHRSTALLWSLCGILIAALHIGIFWAALHWRTSAPPALPPASAVMIDLAPLPVAPPAPPHEMPPGPKQNFAQPPPQLVQQPRLQAPPSPAPQIVIPLPPPKPPRPHRAMAHRMPVKPADKPPAPATTAPPQLQAPASASAAPAPGVAVAASSTTIPSWQAMLLARLEQFKTYPHEAQLNHEEGVVYLHFIMDRQGRVLSADIVTSSGFDTLDQETLALIHRAAPLPSPPPEIPGNPIELTVPVQFFLK